MIHKDMNMHKKMAMGKKVECPKEGSSKTKYAKGDEVKKNYGGMVKKKGY